MNRIIEKIWNLVSHDKDLSLRDRVYRLICLMIAVGCLFIVLPANLLQQLPLYVELANISLGLAALYFYRASLRGRIHVELFIIILVLSISSAWFPNAGSQGSVTFYLLIVSLLPVALSQGRKRWYLVFFLQLNVCLLLLLEHFFPFLTTPFRSQTDRLVDLISGVFCSTLFVSVLLWLVINRYESQQNLTQEMSRKLSASEKNYREVVETANTIIVRINRAGTITFINKFVETLFNVTRANICGKNIIGSLIPQSAPSGESYQKQIEQLLNDLGGSHSIEIESKRTEGANQWICWNSYVLNEANQEVSEILLMGTDITERKILDEKRLHEEQQRIHLQRLESLGFLAGGIAHDFNNILTAIMGNTSILKGLMPRDRTEFDLLVEIETASLRARDLTAQLLTFAKGGKPILSAVDLKQVVQEVVNELPPQSNISCSINSVPGCWPIRADTVQIKQVISNLCLNAFQAMPQGGCVDIIVKNHLITHPNSSFLSPGRYVEFKVKDQGVGIPAENLKKIFDPYYTTKKDASGLGLAVAFSIVRNHGGSITVDSHLGIGTEFTVVLPALSEFQVKLPVLSVAPTIQSKRVLVMDDEESICKMVCRMLRKLGYEADQAQDGVRALEMYRNALSTEKPFGAVIMDLTIPNGMGGKQAIKDLLDIDPAAKAIVSSGYSNDPIMSDHKSYGFCAVMQKPYSSKDLESVLNQVLSDPND